MQEERWQVLATSRVLEHPFLTVSMTQVRLPDGRIIDDWPIVHMRDYVMVFALNLQGQAMVIEGYKHGLGRSSWQVVGGYLEMGEEPLCSAQRELLEETGFVSDLWDLLGTFVVDLNRHGGTGHYFLARDVRQESDPSDHDLAHQSVNWVHRLEIAATLRDGRVAGMSHTVAISLALLTLGRDLTGTITPVSL